MHSRGVERNKRTMTMYRVGRAWISVAVGGMLIGASPVCAAVYSALGNDRRHAVQADVSERRATILVAGAEGDEPISKPCKEAATWEAVAPCLELRKRELFSRPGQSAKSGAQTFAVEMSPGKALPGGLPQPLSFTPDEQLDLGKARTLRRLENDQKLDFERDLRDFLDTR